MAFVKGDRVRCIAPMLKSKIGNVEGTIYNPLAGETNIFVVDFPADVGTLTFCVSAKMLVKVKD